MFVENPLNLGPVNEKAVTEQLNTIEPWFAADLDAVLDGVPVVVDHDTIAGAATVAAEYYKIGGTAIAAAASVPEILVGSPGGLGGKYVANWMDAKAGSESKMLKYQGYVGTA